MTIQNPEDHVTPREVERLSVSIDTLATVVGELRGEIGGLRAEFSENYVRKDVLAPQLEVMDIRIDGVVGDVGKHSDWLLWAQRIVIGCVITALLYLVINGGA